MAAAFLDDTVMAYIFPDRATRLSRLDRFFATLIAADAKVGSCFVTDGGEASTVWRRPGQAKAGLLEMLGQAAPMVRVLGTAMPRAMRVASAIEAHMPAYPFLYLHIAGCDPRFQGKGFGSRAIAAGLAQAGDGPAYLETPNPATLGLYARHGFELVGEWSVRRGGPRFWSMLRPPSA